MRYEERSDASSIGPISTAFDYWKRHLIVPFGCVWKEIRSRGLSVTMGEGRVGLVDPAI